MLEAIRHKVFISYHHDDQSVVNDFVQTFDRERRVFIGRVVGGPMATEIEINSERTDYVMQRIRALYLSDSTVTIVILGDNTWGRKYVDWEIATTLRQGQTIPSGLLGIAIPGKTETRLPERFKDNWSQKGAGYAQFYPYPRNKNQLKAWIDDAFDGRRTRAHLITNGRLLRQRNAPIS